MKRLPYIEDYIDILGGGGLIWPPRDPIIKLARYDEPIVESMANQLSKGTGFTDRQSVLAHKIVVKYRRQWATAGYDVGDHVTSPKFKFPIRQIDRRRIIDIEDNAIVLRFPYDQDLIGKLRADSTSIPGSLRWLSDRHAWVSSLIEPRIIWAREFGTLNTFEFGAAFEAVLAETLSISDYAIELVRDQSGYKIENAAESLQEYVAEHIGFDDPVALIDAAAILGYTVSEQILEPIRRQLDPTVYEIMTSRTVNSTYDTEITNIEQVVEYAKITNRWPIYIYESGSRTLLDKISKLFAVDEIITTGHHLITPEHLDKCRVVYFTHWKKASDHMPLLVTMHTLLIGHRRQQVANMAEKIIYYTRITESTDATM